MVLKLTFSVDYEDARARPPAIPAHGPSCPRASPSPKYPPTLLPNSPIIYICIWVLRFISRIPILQKL